MFRDSFIKATSVRLNTLIDLINIYKKMVQTTDYFLYILTVQKKLRKLFR